MTPFVRDLVISVIAGAGLGAIGPFGTLTDLTAAERYGYWVILTALLWLQFWAVRRSLERASWFDRLPAWAQAAAAALIAAIPTTFEVAWAEGRLRVGGPLSPASMVQTYWGVAVVALALCLPLHLLDRRRPKAAVVVAGDFAARIPSRLGSNLIALAAEDHYLRVRTDRGDDLIHYRLSEAVTALGERGVQTHRSWWVAKGAVEQVEKSGDRVTLILPGGLRAPVSRTFLQGVRAAGLIPADPRD